jgi:tRNA(adenine34) deaminase
MHYSKKDSEILHYLKEKIKTITEEIPIVAVITDHKGNIITEAQNQKALFPFDHAECIAIQRLQETKSTENLLLYTSLEPCIMCVGIAIHARIKTIFYGAYSNNHGIQTKHKMVNIKDIAIIPIDLYHHEIIFTVQSFFKKKRT